MLYYTLVFLKCPHKIYKILTEREIEKKNTQALSEKKCHISMLYSKFSML